MQWEEPYGVLYVVMDRRSMHISATISLHSAVHEALLPGNSHNKFKLAERGKRAETCTKRIEYSLSPLSALLMSMTRRWIPATVPSCVPS